MNNLYGWTISLKLRLGAFKWVENTPQSSKDFIENYNEDSDEGYFLKLMFNIQKNYMTFRMIYLS